MSRPAVFLDRDGVLNALVLNPATGKMESPLVPCDLCLLDGVIPALRRLQAAGYPLILVSNQPNYALGKSSLDTLAAIHQRLTTDLSEGGIRLTRVCYCLHHPQGVVDGYSGLCVCRKPSPWFLLRARDDFGYALADSWMIGDQPTDMHCARAAGARSIRIAPDATAGMPEADYVVPTLSGAAAIILGQNHSASSHSREAAATHRGTAADPHPPQLPSF